MRKAERGTAVEPDGITARPIIPWVGGKEKLAPYILQILPPNPNVYVEPFGGSGAILLGLPRVSSRLDIYNDYDDNLVNLMLCTKERPLALLQELRFLPLHARREFDLLKRCMEHEDLASCLRPYREEETRIAQLYFTPDETRELLEILQGKAELFDVRRAAAFFLLSHGSFNATMKSFAVKGWDLESQLQKILLASRRLAGVAVENMDGVELIRQRDSAGTLFYCDPPYYMAEQFYRAVFSPERHRELHDTLAHCRGMCVVSYNDCAEIRELYRDFYILAFKRSHSMARSEGAQYAELILTNYDPGSVVPQMSLFGESGIYEGMELVHTPDSTGREQ